MVAPTRSVEIRLPHTLPHQREVLETEASRKVAANGRRWGKTIAGLICVLDGHGPLCGCASTGDHAHLLPGHRRHPGALHGAKIWWVVPEYKTATEVWAALKWAARGAWTFKSERDFTLRLPGAGTVTIRSADDPDSLRGFGLDGVVFDEAAKIAEQVWTEVMPPALMDRSGWALFISTPKGTNWFHKLWLRADRPGWARWQQPSWANAKTFPGGEHDPKIEEARRELGPLEFAQEIEAKFITAGRGLFKPQWERWWFDDVDASDAPIYRLKHEREGDEPRDDAYLKITCWRFQTVDLALSSKQEADYTCISTWDVTPLSDLLLVHVLRERIEGPDINTVLADSYHRFLPAKQLVEATQFQQLVVQTGLRAGLPMESTHPDKDKVSRALVATARMKGGKVWFPRYRPEWLDAALVELYSFPLGDHDDFVDTFAYAVREVADVSEALTQAPIPIEERPSRWRM